MERLSRKLFAVTVALFIIAVITPLSNETVSPLGCNSKCLIDNLQKPVIKGNFTTLFFPNSDVIVVAGGVSNFGTRTAFNVNMTLYWTRTGVYHDGDHIQETLGAFNLGNIDGRNTLAFTHQIPQFSSVTFHVDVVNATFVWG